MKRLRMAISSRRVEQGNVTHIIDAEYSWQVAVAMVKAEEEASWPSIEE